MRWVVAISFFTVLSCSSEMNVTSMKGSFMFGTQGLTSLDLETNGVSKIIDTPFRLVKYFDFITSDKLLVSAYDLKATQDREKIEVWSVNGSIIESFEHGSNASYFDNSNTVVFYNSNGHLVRKNLNHSVTEQVILERNNKFQNKPVIKTGDGTFLFVKEVNGEYRIYEFSLLTDMAIDKPAFGDCSLDKSLWIPYLSALLCQYREQNGKITNEYFLIDANGKSTQIYFNVPSVWPITIFDDGSKILLQQRITTNMGTKEIHPLWVYDLVEKKSVKVAENVYVSGVIRERNF